MKYLAAISLIFVGVIHLLPLSGALGVSRLADLYGVRVEDTNLAVLMRHRAVLFGLLGVFLFCAGFQPVMQPAAFIAGFVSVVSFLWLAWSTGHLNASLGRVAFVDIVAAIVLSVGAGARWWLDHFA